MERRLRQHCKKKKKCMEENERLTVTEGGECDDSEKIHFLKSHRLYSSKANKSEMHLCMYIIFQYQLHALPHINRKIRTSADVAIAQKS